MKKPSPVARNISLASADGDEPCDYGVARNQGTVSSRQWLGNNSTESHRASISASDASTEIQAIKDRARKARSSLTSSVGAISVRDDGEVVQMMYHQGMNTMPRAAGSTIETSSFRASSSSLEMMEVRVTDQPAVGAVHDTSPLTPWSHMQQARHPSSTSTSASTPSMASGSVDGFTLRERARQMAALALPGLVEIPDTSDNSAIDRGPPQTIGQEHGREYNSVSSSAYSRAMASTEMQSMKDRVHRSRDSISYPGVVMLRGNDQVDLEYSNPYAHSALQGDMNLGASSFQSEVTPKEHIPGGSTSLCPVDSFENSPTISSFETRQGRGSISSVVSPSSTTSPCDIQGMKQRARHGRLSITQPGAASIPEESRNPGGIFRTSKGGQESVVTGSDGLFVDAKHNGSSNPAVGNSNLQISRGDSDRGSKSHFVNPFMESERPTSGRMAPVLDLERPALSTIIPENGSSMRIMPVDREPQLNDDLAGEKVDDSDYYVSRPLCLFCVAIVVIVVIGVTIGVTSNKDVPVGSPAPLPYQIAAAECIAAVDSAGQSAKFLQFSETFGLSKPETARREALCWLALSEQVQIGPMDVPQAEQLFSLASLYFSSKPGGDGDSPLINWLTDSNECGWQGVSCDNSEVKKLTLSGLGLEGAIPSELSHLSGLSELSLDGNVLTGSIPKEIYQLTNLTILNLEDNSLTGSLSRRVGKLTSLSVLNIGLNRLMAGTLPDDLFSLTGLEFIYMLKNNFEGSIHPSIGGMTNLRIFAADYNSFNGTVPTEIGLCTSLIELGISNTDIASTIPSEIGMLARLTALSLGDKMDGTIPTELGECSSMVNLALYTNVGLMGTIPSELGNLSLLEALQLQFTKLTGTMPSEICSLRELELRLLGSDCLGREARIECAEPECCTECY